MIIIMNISLLSQPLSLLFSEKPIHVKICVWQPTSKRASTRILRNYIEIFFRSDYDGRKACYFVDSLCGNIFSNLHKQHNPKRNSRTHMDVMCICKR